MGASRERAVRDFCVDDFVRYNDFYGKPYGRRVVLQLYKGKCATCDQIIEGEHFHVAHIIPRSRPDLMEDLLPGLTVDNLLNLRLSCPDCNYKESNFIFRSLFLQHAFNHSARVIASRLESILKDLDGRRAPAVTVQMSGADPKICTDVLALDVHEIRGISSEWHGALVIPKAELDARIVGALVGALGVGGEHLAYETLKEGLSYFRNRLLVEGRSISLSVTGACPWLLQAKEILGQEVRDPGTFPASRQTAGLIDGVYLDPADLDRRGGLLLPLRTESQRWFRNIFSIILPLLHALRTRSHKGYLALREWEWGTLCHCYQNLRVIEPGVRRQGRRLGPPDAVAHFTLDGDELLFGDETLEIPGVARQICQTAAVESGFGNGTLVRRAKLEPWLARAFSLADGAVQQIVGPHLIRVDGQMSSHWVPPLPRLSGRTRDDVRRESAQRFMRRGGS